MTDEAATAGGGRSVPAWYWVAVIGVLLFEAAGCYAYISQVSADPGSLPVDQRAMWAATPQWMIAAYAVAVWVGLVGAVLLLMRRRLAEPVLLASLVAVVVQFSGLFLVTQLRETTPSDALFLPIVITILCYAIWQLAKLARRRGWLR